ncbi:MAG: FAD-dependent thymidylate synthase [Gemmatimonadota bacterium]
MAETRRPTIPAAEEILGGYFSVLDHGFVSLVDYMGSDEDIERAARVSYGYGTRKRSATRGLIRYLRRHAHTTPSEMVEFKFHCSMPIFVARQWIRHRTACLAEGTEVYFDLPGGIERRGNQLYKLRIEDLWERFVPTRNTSRPDKQRNPYFRRERVQQMHLRQANEDSLDLQHTRIVDVIHNGPKPVFRVTLSDGKSIEATADHRFLFADGWSTLRDAVGLEEKNGLAIWARGDHFVYVNGLVMEEPALYREIAAEAGVSYHTIRKWGGHEPWNKGMTYELGPRQVSAAWLAANRGARSGPASNFWRGGTSTDRDAIGRWTTQAAPRVHRRNGWTCQLCEERASELHCHHIVPVWADDSLAREESNLTTLCGTCHRSIHGREQEVAEQLAGRPVHANWNPRPRVAWNKLTKAVLARVESIEFTGVKETYDLEVEGPYHNFIANGIVTHNSVNEYSGRYSLMPLLFYKPEPPSFALQSAANNQGREDEPADPSLYADAIARWESLREQASDTYGWLVSENIARELARIDLPLSTYTQWYWKIDLHNLLHFLRLRADPHAQWEIQEYGRVMAGMLARVAPLTYEAWLDYDVLGTRMSAAELGVIRSLIEPTGDGLRARGGSLTAEDLKSAGLSGRESRELLDKLEPVERPDFALDLSQMQTPESMADRMAEAVPDAPV